MIKILFFASLRERVGVDMLELPFDQNWRNAADAIASAKLKLPALQNALASNAKFLLAINQDLAKLETPVQDGDELALLPPVTGG